MCNGNICLSRKDWHPRQFAKVREQATDGSNFQSPVTVLGSFLASNVNGSITWPVLSDFSIYLKLRELHTWSQLVLKSPNKSRATNSTQFPSSSEMEKQGSLAAHKLWPCILSSDQSGDVHAQLKGPGFSVQFWLSTTRLTDIQRDQQLDESASSKNAENDSFCAPIISTSCAWKHTKAHNHTSTSSTQWQNQPIAGRPLPLPKSTEQDKETFRVPDNLLLSQHMLNKTLLSNRERGWINITTSPHSN